MSTQSQNGYMLLFRGTQWDKDLSPEEIQKMVTEWHAWFEGLTREGKCKAGQPLEREGKIVSGRTGRTVNRRIARTDGRYSPEVGSFKDWPRSGRPDPGRCPTSRPTSRPT